MSYWSTTILFFSFFLHINISWAFQGPIPPYSFSIPELNELRIQAELKVSHGSLKEAIKAYQKLQKKCWEYNLDSVAIDIYEDIFTATLLLEDQDFEKTLNFIDSSYKTKKNTNIKGIYYGAVAHTYLFYGEVDSMKKYYDLAISILKQQKRYLQITNLNTNIALEFYYLEDFPNATKYLIEAEKHEKDYLLLKNLYTPSLFSAQTAIYRILEEYPKALRSSLALLDHYKKNNIKTPYVLIYEYNNLAATYGKLNDYDNALSYYKKAISLIKEAKIDDPREITHILYNIGLNYNEQGDITKAKKYFLKSIQLIKKTDLSESDLQENLINNCHSLIDCYSQNKDSTFYYFKILEDIHKSNSYRLYFTYQKYSLYFLRRHDLKKAKTYASKALEATIKVYGANNAEVSNRHVLLARVMFAQRKYNKAFEYLQQALDILSVDFSDDQGLSNPTLEQVLEKSRLLNVLNVKMKYLNILYNQDYPLATQKDLYQTAKLATETIEAINRGIKSRKSQLFWLNQEAIPSFERAIQIALSIYKKTNNVDYLNEAFVLAERSKSMLMVSTFQENEAFNSGILPNDLVKKEQNLYKLLAETRKKHFDAKLSLDLEAIQVFDSLIFEYKDQMMTLLHKFELEYPEYFKLKYSFKSVDIKAVQDILDNKTTFIEYFEGAHNVYAFSITKKSASVQTIPRTDTYSQDIDAFQSVLIGLEDASKNTAKNYNSLIQTAYNFHQTFIPKNLSQNHKRLIIVPDGQLSYLPFEVFLTQEVPLDVNQSNSEANFATLPYLIRDYKINYNYSATLWIEHLMRKATSKNGQILALAPSYKNTTTPEWRSPYEKKLRTELVELPGAIRELSFLEWTFDGSFLAENNASETAFKNQALDYSVLHFAVHGLVDTKNPEFSGLALAEDNSKTEDNILYTYEIKQLGLNANLVVLSACETGIGKYQLGEGILSIGRDFMYAGVPSMLTTLWSLNDYSSSIIIEHFYTNLSAGMEKDEAIRQAKLFYIDNYNGLSTHPALWACFVQVGDYSAIPLHKNYMRWYIGLAVFLLLGSITFAFLKFRKR